MSVYDALHILSKAGWDASWGANHSEEIAAAHSRLVAAIERLEALESIARDVAAVNTDAWGATGEEGPWVMPCCMCRRKIGGFGELKHAVDCPVSRARALLGEQQEA